jgi:hypothetical protein
MGYQLQASEQRDYANCRYSKSSYCQQKESSLASPPLFLLRAVQAAIVKKRIQLLANGRLVSALERAISIT